MESAEKKINNCGAVITAAGMSRRMKAFKPLLELGQSTILRSCLDAYIDAGCSPIILVTGRNADQIEDHVRDLPVECVFNTEYETCDMFHSVKTGLAAIEGRCGRLFIAPADIPLIAPDTLRLLEAADGYIIRPSYQGRTGHPVLIASELITGILSYEGTGGLKGALEAMQTEDGKDLSETIRDRVLQIVDLETKDPGILLDADTPEDYEKLKDYEKYKNYAK